MKDARFVQFALPPQPGVVPSASQGLLCSLLLFFPGLWSLEVELKRASLRVHLIFSIKTNSCPMNIEKKLVAANLPTVVELRRPWPILFLAKKGTVLSSQTSQFSIHQFPSVNLASLHPAQPEMNCVPYFSVGTIHAQKKHCTTQRKKWRHQHVPLSFAKALLAPLSVFPFLQCVLCATDPALLCVPLSGF